MTGPASACPKKMTYGPCGDVGGDGSCEVPTEAGGPPRCVFLDVALRLDASLGSRRAPGRTEHGTDRPFIMSELPEDANSSTDIRRVARRLAGSVDAVLFGDANWMRVRLPPSYRARLVQDEGLGAWPGLNARDRNRVALESELLALADIGVAGVHCVTGNHTYSGNRPTRCRCSTSTRRGSLRSRRGSVYGSRWPHRRTPHRLRCGRCERPTRQRPARPYA